MEVALLFGLSGVAFGLADLLISQVENASRHIKAGTFDLFLLRPLPPLLHLSASEFALRRIGRVLQPLVVLIGALVLAPIEWSPETVAARAGHARERHGDLRIRCGSRRRRSRSGRWTARRSPTPSPTAGSWRRATRSTSSRDWLRRLLTFIVPLAFVAYFPAARLLGKRAAARAAQRDRLGHPARRRPRGPGGAGDVATRRPPPPEHGELTWPTRRDHRCARVWPRPSTCTARPAGCGVAASRSPPSTASTCRSSAARWSATSVPTGRGSPRPSRCSPASSCPRAATCGWTASSRAARAPSWPRRIGVVFGQRSQLWWDLPLRDSFDLLRHVYRVPAARHAENLARFADGARPRPAARRPRSPAVARPADARRAHGGAPPRSVDPPPRRADDRAGRGQQGGRPRVPHRREPGARHHGAAHHPRPGRRGAPLRAAAHHRPRHPHRGQHRRGHHRALRHRAHPRRRPGRAGSAARGRRGAGHAGRRARGSGSGSAATT